MNFEFLRTLHGFINLLQVCFGFAAIFASSLIWVDSNLYFQFIYKGFGWQTLILFILVITFLFAFVILFSNIFGKDVLGTVGKRRAIFGEFRVNSAFREIRPVSVSIPVEPHANCAFSERPLLLLYAICLILLVVSASLETWYIRLSAGYLHSRFIAVTVFNWLLVVSYIALIVVTILFV